MKTTILLLTLATSVLSGSNPYNGYIDSWGNEVPGLITNDTWMTPMPTHVSGKAVFYGPYAMDATAEYRKIDYEREGCVGGISLMSPYNIGDKAWVKLSGKWYGPYCVVDCAKRGDMYSIVVYREEIVEINFELAVELGMVSPHNNGDYRVYKWYLPAEVLVNISPDKYFSSDQDREPINYKDHFLETLVFAKSFEPRVILTKDGLWKEYATDKYWIKRDYRIQAFSLSFGFNALPVHGMATKPMTFWY